MDIENATTVSVMLSVKEAAHSALAFYKDIYPDIQGELIEEVELDAERRNWLITLSFPVKADQKNPLTVSSILTPQFERQYKLFKVSTDDGHVESMKIRVLGNDPN